MTPELIESARSALRSAGIDTGAARSVFVPGRIEVLGKHTDYCGGRSLLCAVEQGIGLTYVPRTDTIVRVIRAQTGEAVEFDAASSNTGAGQGHWSKYWRIVAGRVTRNFPGLFRGMDAAFDSNLPPAAGLSSSSALVVGAFMALSEVNGLDCGPGYKLAIRNRDDLAAYLGAVENGQSFLSNGVRLAGDRGAGTLGGSQDHTAILCSTPGSLVQYGFLPVLREDKIPLPAAYRFVVATCGIVAEKGGAAQTAYNRNPLAVQYLLQIWNQAMGRADACLAAAVRSDRSAFGRFQEVISGAPSPQFSPAFLMNRLSQFIAESERIIPAAASALKAQDWQCLGELVDESQLLAGRCLGNQLAQTEFLASSAREAGAVAASAFGAGFGGSVYALVREADADEFLKDWLDRYKREFPGDGANATGFVTSASHSAFESLEVG